MKRSLVYWRIKIVGRYGRPAPKVSKGNKYMYLPPGTPSAVTAVTATDCYGHQNESSYYSYGNN